MSKRNINILDKIGGYIPGYKDYAIRDDIRNNDKKLRTSISSEIENMEREIIKIQQELIRNNNISTCKEWELVRKSLNTFLPKIKNASYGATSMLNNEQIDEKELEEIYSFDLEIAERVNLMSKTVNNEIEEVLSPILLNQQIKELDKILMKRTDYINKF